jgi:hypothetical protein
VKRGTYWNNATAVTDAFCSRGGMSVYSEIALNGKTIDGSMTANFDYAYDKVMGLFTNNGGVTRCQGFYPLKATDDYILRVQMGADGGETDFTIYASESTHLTFRTGTDGHSNQVLFMKANGSWNSETRVGYDLSRFVNLDGVGGVVDFTVVRHNQGLYVYVCDYIDEITGLAMKHETWQLVFSCTTNPNQARFELTTHDPWGHVITDGNNVRTELKTGVLGVVGAFENAFAFNNFSSLSSKWKISLDDIDEHAAAFVASPQKVAYI